MDIKDITGLSHTRKYITRARSIELWSHVASLPANMWRTQFNGIVAVN